MGYSTGNSLRKKSKTKKQEEREQRLKRNNVARSRFCRFRRRLGTAFPEAASAVLLLFPAASPEGSICFKSSGSSAKFL